MEFLDTVLFGPIRDMVDAPSFFLEVVFGGLMSGVMYSLVALRIALVYWYILVLRWSGKGPAGEQ